MRIMAIDLGDARTGLAVSDLLGMLCGEAWTVKEWNMERLADLICEEAAKRGVQELVLGLPKNMDGTEGPRAEKSRTFQRMLGERTAIPVILWDERLSTVSAQKGMIASNMNRKKRRKMVDTMAAVVILQGYLDSIC